MAETTGEAMERGYACATDPTCVRDVADGTLELADNVMDSYERFSELFGGDDCASQLKAPTD